MSIYVLRSDNLVKIGFTDNLRTRVQNIIAAVPLPVEFVGHMPGDRKLEAHLHERFASHRFVGEWFVETPEMRTVFDAVLTPRLPAIEPKEPSKKRTADADAVSAYAAQLRKALAERWPHLSSEDRIKRAAKSLGWTRSRVFSLYYSDPRVAVRAFEKEELDQWLVGSLDRTGTEG